MRITTTKIKTTNMKEFVLLFRRPELKEPEMDSKKIEAYRKKWDDWLNGFPEEIKLSSTGFGLSEDGKILKPSGVITDGPFVELKEKLGGLAVIKAETLDEAITLAHGCPVLEMGGSVEVREAFLVKEPGKSW
jgi:hypothetical protein